MDMVTKEGREDNSDKWGLSRRTHAESKVGREKKESNYAGRYMYVYVCEREM